MITRTKTLSMSCLATAILLFLLMQLQGRNLSADGAQPTATKNEDLRKQGGGEPMPLEPLPEKENRPTMAQFTESALSAAKRTHVRRRLLETCRRFSERITEFVRFNTHRAAMPPGGGNAAWHASRGAWGEEWGVCLG